MCGRYLIDDEAYADIWEMLNDPDSVFNINRGEVFPTNTAAVIVNDGVMVAKWGFPHWKNTSVLINARAETALEKKMFRKPLLESRCVVPSSGFYEWRRSGERKVKEKDKYLLRKPGERLLYMAGMINTFRDPFGEQYSAFVILTTAANESVVSIHDRMPVILESDETNLWTQDSGFMEYALFRPGPELEAEPV
jgi:putative SOS response-associated peptidase YedK